MTAISVAGTAPSHAKHTPDAKTQASAQADGADKKDDGELHDVSGAPISDDQVRMLANLIG